MCGSRNSIYLLVWNSRHGTEESVREWIELLSSITSRGYDDEEVEVVLIATHIDLMKNRINEVEEILQSYKSRLIGKIRVREYFLTSKNNGEDIQKVKSYIINQIEKNCDSVPTQYEEVLRHIQSFSQSTEKKIHDKNYMSRYLEGKVKNENDLVKESLKYYKGLGMIINFDTVEGISDKVVTDIQLLINIIRTITNKQETTIKKGIISNQNISRLWINEFKIDHNEVEAIKQILHSLGLMFPLVERGLPVQQNVIPLLLRTQLEADNQHLIQLPYNGKEKWVCRLMETQQLTTDAIIGKTIACLWKIVDVQSMSRSGVTFIETDDNGKENKCTILKHNKKAIKLIGRGDAALAIVCKVYDVLESVMSAYYSGEVSYRSLCATCVKNNLLVPGSWSKGMIHRTIINGKVKIKCPECGKKQEVIEHAWNLGGIYTIFKSNRELHKTTSNEIFGNFMRYPLHDMAAPQQMTQMRSLARQGRLKMEDFNWIKRIGAKTSGKGFLQFEGSQGALYLCQYTLTLPNNKINKFTCVVKINYNYELERSQVEAQMQKETNIQTNLSDQSECVGRVICWFVDRLIDPEIYLPQWDADVVKKGTEVGMTVMDVFESSLKTSPDDGIYILQVLKGLMQLQKNKIAHADIKAPNILIDSKTKYAVLTDFGTALELKPNFVWKNDQGWGSSDGLPPELQEAIKKKQPHSAEKADMWAMGRMIFDLLDMDADRMIIISNEENRRTITDEPTDVRGRIAALAQKMVKNAIVDRITCEEAVRELEMILFWSKEDEQSYDLINLDKTEQGFQRWKQIKQADLITEMMKSNYDMLKKLGWEFIESISTHRDLNIRRQKWSWRSFWS